jgi:hypothetical protein
MCGDLDSTPEILSHSLYTPIGVFSDRIVCSAQALRLGVMVGERLTSPPYIFIEAIHPFF